MDKKEVKNEYERKVCESFREGRMTVEEGVSVSEVFKVLKGAVTSIIAEMVGYRPLRDQG